MTAWILLALGLALGVGFRLGTFHPPQRGPVRVLPAPSAVHLQAGQSLKVLSWNIQFMAGKNNLFWFDLPDLSGPDSRPSRADIERTIADVARIVCAENPDILLLQEVGDGHSATDGEDQLARLLALLPEEYANHTSAFYVYAAFVPHRHVLGSVGIKLSIV